MYKVIISIVAAALFLLALPAGAEKKNEVIAYGKGWDVALVSSATVCRDSKLFMTWPGGVGNKRRWLLEFDISMPAKPKLLSKAEVSGFALDMAISGNELHLVNGLELLVFDISKPGGIRLRSRLAMASDPFHGPQGVAVRGDTVYLACRRSGVKIVVVGKPDAPRIVGACPIDAFVGNVSIHQDRLFASAEARGVYVLDVTSSAQPRLVQHVPLSSGCAGRMCHSADTIYLAGGSEAIICAVDKGNDGLHLLGNTQNRGILSPFYGKYSFQTACFGSADAGRDLAKRHVAVADGECGLVVMDVGDPSSPRFHGALMEGVGLGSPYFVTSLCVKGTFVYLNDNHYGVRVADLSDPAHPALVGVGVDLKPIR